MDIFALIRRCSISILSTLNYCFMQCWLSSLNWAEKWEGIAIALRFIHTSQPKLFTRLTVDLNLPYQCLIDLLYGMDIILLSLEWKQFLILHYVKAVAIFWALLGSLTPFGVGVHRNARNPNKLIYCISLSRGSYLWWPQHTKSPFLLTLYYFQRKLLRLYWCSKKFYKMHSWHFIFGIISLYALNA